MFNDVSEIILTANVAVGVNDTTGINTYADDTLVHFIKLLLLLKQYFCSPLVLHPN